MQQKTISRRALLSAGAALPVIAVMAGWSLAGGAKDTPDRDIAKEAGKDAGGVGEAAAAALPLMTVSKDPNCGCCGGWIKHMEAAGFPVKVVNSDDMEAVKARLGVPADLASCHTMEVDGYVVEGHVPAVAIRRLLAERPEAKGLAVPGMPSGSPGMDFPGAGAEIYEAFLYGSSIRSFGRYQGPREV